MKTTMGDTDPWEAQVVCLAIQMILMDPGAENGTTDFQRARAIRRNAMWILHESGNVPV